MAATTMMGGGGDAINMEQKKLEYFSSINSMAKKIMQEREKIKEKYGSTWENMTPAEQDSAIDNVMMDPHVRARYAMHRTEREEVVCYPKLLLQTGQKIVHFGEEDLTWQDEHSAPFSWETKSQLDFSLSSGAPELTVTSSSVVDPKPIKPLPGSQLAKVAPSSKSSTTDSLGRREEESSFWKISLERSRLEGEKADFQSLTPSQIKSMEKGEKPLPSYLRPDSDDSPSPTPPPQPQPTKKRAPRPPAPPPPIPVSAAPAPISVTSSASSGMPPPPPPPSSASTGGWERSQSTLPSASPLEDIFSPGLASKSPARAKGSPARQEEKIDSPPGSSPTFSQFASSSGGGGGGIVKTGFDFLDNW